jgi:hypothetical protein
MTWKSNFILTTMIYMSVVITIIISVGSRWDQGGWIQQTKTNTGEATLAGAGGVLKKSSGSKPRWRTILTFQKPMGCFTFPMEPPWLGRLKKTFVFFVLFV